MKQTVYFLAFAAMLFFLTTCGRDEPKVEEVIRPVRYMEVYSTGGQRVRTFSGVAKSGVESNLSFKVSGTVEEVAVEVGDQVKAGDLIARVDPEDYQLKVQQAEAALTQAQAQKQRARADYERIRSLYENENASKSDLDATRAAFESASAQVESAEKALELARLQLSYTRLTAPASGSIASVDIEINENVQPGKTIVMLTAGSHIEVEVAIPEILISQIEQGDSVRVQFDALPTETFAATVSEVGVASTGYATTFPVTVRLNEKVAQIRSGMAAEVAFHFKASEERDRMIVPSVAVGEDRKGQYVYVVQPTRQDTGVVQRVNVQVGELVSDGLEVFGNLSDGDLVVTAGVSKIHDGQKVKL